MSSAIFSNNPDQSVDVIMPMLGGGTRMNGMQNTCKPLYVLPDGQKLFLKALSSLKAYKVFRLLLLVLPEYEEEFRACLDDVKKMFPNSAVFIIPHEPTKNQVETFRIGLSYLDGFTYRYPIISLDCDICGTLPMAEGANGAADLFVFKHDNPNKSFVKTAGTRVTGVVEKQKVSDLAVFGAYLFRDIEALEETLKTNCKFEYMSEIYDCMIREHGKLVYWHEVYDVKSYGTEEEWKSLVEDKKYKALLFDFDGTLYDTKKLNFKAYQLAYFDLGVTITEEMFAKTDGLSVYDFNRAMGVDCDLEKLKELKAGYYKDFLKYARPNKYLIRLIENTKLKTALVTTARRTNIDSLLRVDGLNHKFSTMVFQDDVEKHKPAPDAYLKAIEMLGVKPEECLVFEDSRPGFVAAREAGCDCVMVGKFEEDCVRNLSGGSDATTKLLIEGDRLVVKKEALGKKNVERLYNQYKKLAEEANNSHYIKVIGNPGKISEEYFGYCMPYEPAPSLYEYLNKVKKIPELVSMLYNDSGLRNDRSPYNQEDIREFCYYNYILPGMEIYEEVTGVRQNKVFTDWQFIPKTVNKYRRSPYHGDATFENVLVERNGSLLLIDPVPDGNAVQGLVHDYSKMAQSLMGYEAIRDGKDFDYEIELDVFDRCMVNYLDAVEYSSLKFHTACLFYRRLKHQVQQNPDLVKPYGDIAHRLLSEFASGDYSWRNGNAK